VARNLISIDWRGPVAIIVWDDGENRVNPDSMRELHEAFDELEELDGQLAVVLSGVGKFFSNGLDLDRFADRPDELGETSAMLRRLFSRVLVFPAYVIAAINGHAFAAGAMLTCTADYRVMREDRGYWCLNEAEIGLPLSEAMASLVLGRLPKASAREAMLTARRFSAPEAVAAGIVEESAPADEVLGRAIVRATEVAGKDRAVVAAHKRLALGAIAREIDGAGRSPT
jgi:enoyl-CoA hydratase/carnithine racemase